ncbi:MAG: RnfABCDGE type electron transport complex subunit D [Thermomicrobiales bacterium]
MTTWVAMKRFFRTPKGYLLLILALLAVLASADGGTRRSAIGLFGAVAAAVLVDIAIVRVWRGVWFFPSGALLSGLIVALILSRAEPWYVPAATAAIAVASKYALRTRRGHIFNPAALALVAAYFLFASGQDWWGALANLPVPFIAILLATGIFVADRVNKLPMVLIFLGCYFLLFTGFAFARDATQVVEIFRAPDVNATLFFALFMLTDPPTSPTRYNDQIVYAVLVALGAVITYFTFGAVYYLLAGLLIGNAWEMWRRVTARARSSAALART